MAGYSLQEVRSRRLSQATLMSSENNLELDRKVQSFYDETPFPDFDLEKYRTREDLERQASWYFRLLDTYIPQNCSIIEVGCGTGQFVNYLALKKTRKVVGIDLTENSLKKAKSLRDKLGIQNLELRQENIFDLSPETFGVFDYVFCNGVLHHTRDVYKAFRVLTTIVKPGGVLTVGFYNTWGRIPLIIRKFFVKKKSLSLKQKKEILAGQFRVENFDDSQINSWFADQYLHPHEVTVTVNKVLGFLDDNGFDYLNSFPPIEMGKNLKNVDSPHLQRNPFKKSDEKLWKYSSFLLHLKQILWMLKVKNEGGYFTIIAKSRGRLC